jgi:hypothetical protein
MDLPGIDKRGGARGDIADRSPRRIGEIQRSFEGRMWWPESYGKGCTEGYVSPYVWSHITVCRSPVKTGNFWSFGKIRLLQEALSIHCKNLSICSVGMKIGDTLRWQALNRSASRLGKLQAENTVMPIV